MTTDVIYADTSDGKIESSNGTYSTARSGSGLSANTTNFTQNLTGQDFFGQYYCWEGFFQFNTSVVGTDTVSAAVLSFYIVSDSSTTDFTANARLYDWGTSLTTADWIAGASLSANTLLAHKSTAGISTSAYLDFVDDAFPANVNGSGQTRIVVSSSRHEAGNTPTGHEYVAVSNADTSGTTQDPKLTVTHAAAGSNVTVTPDLVALTTTGYAPTVSVSDNKTATPDVAALTTATFAPTVSVSDNKTATPDAVALTLSTFAPTVTASDHKVVTPDTATLAVSGLAPVLDLGIIPGAQSLTITGLAPTVTASDHKIVTPDPASLTLTGLAPVLGLGIIPDAASLTVTGLAPVVSVSDNKSVTPDALALSLSTFAPTVTASDHKTAVPDALALTLSTFAPDVAVSNEIVVTPDTLALSLSTFAPTVTASDHQTVVPGPLGLSLTTFAPDVAVSSPDVLPGGFPRRQRPLRYPVRLDDEDVLLLL